MQTTRSFNKSGIALVAVILVGSIALMTMLFTSSLLSLSARKSASSERHSTQALLAADSGLGTLKARASLVPFPGGSFKEWIEENFSTLDLGGGVSASLSVVFESSELVSVQSVGRIGDFRRAVVQDFTIREGPPLPISVSVPGALTSVSKIVNDSNGLCVIGRANTDAAWTVSDVVTSWGNGNIDCSRFMASDKIDTRKATLCDSYVGQYVNVGHTLYRVVATPENWPPDCNSSSLSEEVTLAPVGGGATVQLVASTEAQIRPTAIAEPLVVSSGPPKTSTVLTSPATRVLFGVGMPISIGNDSSGNPSLGTVTAVKGDELSITWEAGREPASYQGEGSIVRREITSGVSDEENGGCAVRSSSFPQTCTVSDLTGLFNSTFGVSQEALFKSLTEDQIRTHSYATNSNNTLSGLTWVTLTHKNQLKFGGQTGSGILIIDASKLGAKEVVNLNVDNNFDGLIYVIGNAKLNGNANYQGAVIVEGGATLEETMTNGTGGILYDPLQLLKSLANITVPNPVAGELGLAVPNSWRVTVAEAPNE